MPVTITTCDFKSETWSPPLPRPSLPDAETLITVVAADEAKLIKEVLQGTQITEPVHPTPNGLLGAAIDAWSNHHNLVLRPEDFWFSILSQLSFYITGNAEELRAHFVAHEGKKKLTVRQYGTIRSVDYGVFAEMMANELGKNVVDPSLKDWVLPGFTTTTDEDKVIGAVMFMGSMQKYFEYEFDCCTCAIPKIVLLGEREDWEEIQRRIEKFTTWGDAGKKYHAYLVPIFKHIVRSFDEPETPAVVNFWQKMVLRHGPYYMSGGKNTPYITGWITGLFMWTSDGKVREEVAYNYEPDSRHAMVLDGVCYPKLHLEEDLIPAVVSVPVTVRELDDGGFVQKIIKTKIVTGICGHGHCDTPMTPGGQGSRGEISVEGEGQKKESSLRRIANRMSCGMFPRTAQGQKEKMTDEDKDKKEHVASRADDDVESTQDDKSCDGSSTLSSDEEEELIYQMSDGMTLMRERCSVLTGQQDRGGDTQGAGSVLDAVKPMAFWWIFETNEAPDAADE